uniref:Immunoglobulin V-set domain-containing protein n=1 Tax=Astyanax mexicanus TaxID=7994 RepID=A0A8B9H1Y4_ASTMX
MDVWSLLSGGEASSNVTGYSGGGVLIRCKYDKKYTSNSKYFCKGSRPNCDDLIKTGEKNKWVNKGRFSLIDKTSSAEFLVMIRELTVKDFGTYQCAVDISSRTDIYTPVELMIHEGEGYRSQGWAKVETGPKHNSSTWLGNMTGKQ